MILSVINDQRPLKNGQHCAFLTGKKSINTFPKYLRIGKVIDEKDLVIEDLETGKHWKVYPSNVIITGDEGEIKGVDCKLILTDRP